MFICRWDILRIRERMGLEYLQKQTQHFLFANTKGILLILLSITFIVIEVFALFI